MTDSPIEFPTPDTLPPPLPAGLGAPTNSPDAAPRRRGPTVLPIAPRVPGSPAGSPAGQPSPPAPAQATPPAPSPGPAAVNPAAAPTPLPAVGAVDPSAPQAPDAGAPKADDDAAGGGDDAADDHSDDHGGADDQDARDAPSLPKLPFKPADIAGMATGLASPLLELPGMLGGLGSGLLSPLTQILQQFGQGVPAMPAGSDFPQGVLDRLAGADPASVMSGATTDAYGSDLDGQTGQATAMDNLERKLRTALEDSSKNTTVGRDKINQIIEQVKSSIQAMGPIANTPVGQAGALTAVAGAIQQALGVLGDGVGKDALNAGTIKSLSAGYLKDLNTNPGPAGPSKLGKLTTRSTPREIAEAIIAEARRRGYNAQQTIAILSTGMQESGLNPNSRGGGGAWHSIFQQDASYPGRDNPNTNISEFFNRLDGKGGPRSPDIWKSIFWLQQAPGYDSAEYAFTHGRQHYLTEIQSQLNRATDLYRQITT